MSSAYIMDGEGRNPYDLYDGEEYMDDTEEEETLPRYVEVVYCKDCKFRYLPFTRCHWNPEEEPDDDDYCSKGVRR